MTAPQVTCEILVTYLSEYIEQRLDDELTAAADEHLRSCQNCRVVLNTTQRTILLLRDNGLSQALTPISHDRLFEQVRAAFNQRKSPTGSSPAEPAD